MHRFDIRPVLLAAALVVPLAASIGLARAQDETPATPDNAAIARAFYEPLNTGETSAYREVLAADWAAHPPAPGQEPGPEGFAPLVAGLRAAFPDLAVTNDAVIVAGDLVTVRSTLRGTHGGAFLGIPPTGREVEFATIDVHRIEDGLIVETWHVEDYLGVLTQLGVAFAPPASATPVP